MEAKWKLNWDYKISEGFRFTSGTQLDWNNTIVTKINQISAQIYQSSHNGGANRLTMHPNVFKNIMKKLEYTNVDGDGNYKLSGRYKIDFDKELPEDKLYIWREGFPIEPIVYEGVNNKDFVVIHSSSPDLEKYKTKENIDLIIVTPDMLVGEITITNFINTNRIKSLADDDGYSLLYEFLREEYKQGKREFRIAFQEDNHFIIHPMGKDGNTIDLVLTHGDVL